MDVLLIIGILVLANLVLFGAFARITRKV